MFIFFSLFNFRALRIVGLSVTLDEELAVAKDFESFFSAILRREGSILNGCWR